MIKVNITTSQIQEARSMLLSKPLKNSITNGRNEIYGKLGEVIVRDYCSTLTDTHLSPTYDYDLTIGGLKAEVKTKKTSVEPKPHYNCGVTGYNPSQKCDIYVFVRILDDMSNGYILGFLPRSDFFSMAVFCKKDALDDGWSFRSDCYNVTVSQLRNFKKTSS